MENSATFLGIWKARDRSKAVCMGAVHTPRKDLIRPAVALLAELRLCASRKGRLATL